MGQELSDEARDAIALTLRSELARRRISRQRMADEAGISLSTLEKALAGSRAFTLATLLRLETSLGIALRPVIAKGASNLSAVQARSAVAWLEGDYLTLRPSFDTPGAVFAYRTLIAWDEASSTLAFSETGRLDTAFAQVGQVSLPGQSGHVYLVTNSAGQYRLAILSRPLVSGEMYGVLTTLRAGRGAQLIPTVAPLALLPSPEGEIGLIRPGDLAFDKYRRCLDQVTAQGFMDICT